MLLHARHKLNEPDSLLAIISLPLLSSLNEPVRLHTTLYQVTYLYLSTWCILSALLPRAFVPLQAAPACSLDPQVQQVCIIHLLLTLNNAGKVAPLKPSDLLAMRAPDPLVSLSLAVCLYLPSALSVCIYHQPGWSGCLQEGKPTPALSSACGALPQPPPFRGFLSSMLRERERE